VLIAILYNVHIILALENFIDNSKRKWRILSFASPYLANQKQVLHNGSIKFTITLELLITVY